MEPKLSSWAPSYLKYNQIVIMYVNSPDLVSQLDLVLTIPCSFLKKERERKQRLQTASMRCHLASNLFVLYRMSQQELQDHLIYQHQLL